jgi:hypothetical protein
MNIMKVIKLFLIKGVNIILKVMQNYNNNIEIKKKYGLSTFQEFSQISISQIVSFKSYNLGQINSLLNFKQINIEEYLIKNLEISVIELNTGFFFFF